jgi:hypothetical protein
MYKKYVNPDIDLDSLDLSSGEMCDILNFYDKYEYQDFLYNLYAYEIFGEAPVTVKSVDKKFNLWYMRLTEDGDWDEPIEIMLANPMEFNVSIGYTCFFLSKIATRVRDIKFPMDSLTIWNDCDVLITADKKLLENKPDGKIAVKIEMPYNTECQADFTYKTLDEMLDDNNIIDKFLEKK